MEKSFNCPSASCPLTKPDRLSQHSSSPPFISVAAASDLLHVSHNPCTCTCTHARTQHFHADYIHFFVCCARRKATVALTLPQPSFLVFPSCPQRAQTGLTQGSLMASLATNICTDIIGGLLLSSAHHRFHQLNLNAASLEKVFKPLHSLALTQCSSIQSSYLD